MSDLSQALAEADLDAIMTGRGTIQMVIDSVPVDVSSDETMSEALRVEGGRVDVKTGAVFGKVSDLEGVTISPETTITIDGETKRMVSYNQSPCGYHFVIAWADVR